MPAAGRHRSPDRLWEIAAKATIWSPRSPADRWDIDSTYDPNPAARTHRLQMGRVLFNVEDFDYADSLGIWRKGDSDLIHQHRLLLKPPEAMGGG